MKIIEAKFTYHPDGDAADQMAKLPKAGDRFSVWHVGGASSPAEVVSITGNMMTLGIADGFGNVTDSLAVGNQLFGGAKPAKWLLFTVYKIHGTSNLISSGTQLLAQFLLGKTVVYYAHEHQVQLGRPVLLDGFVKKSSEVASVEVSDIEYSSGTPIFVTLQDGFRLQLAIGEYYLNDGRHNDYHMKVEGDTLSFIKDQNYKILKHKKINF